MLNTDNININIIIRSIRVFNFQKYCTIIQIKYKHWYKRMIIMETNNKDLLSTSFPEWITILQSLKKNPSNMTSIDIYEIIFEKMIEKRVILSNRKLHGLLRKMHVPNRNVNFIYLNNPWN